MNLADLLARYAGTQPDAAALLEGERTITWAALDALVRRSAAQLQDLGVRPGDRVGLNLKDHADHVIAMLAAARMGACFVPIDWRARPAEKARLAEAFDLRLALNDPATSPVPDRAGVALDDDWHAAVRRAPTAREFPSEGDAELFIAVSSGTTGAPKGAPATHTMFLHRIAKYTYAYGPMHGHRYLSVQPLCYAAGWFHLFIVMAGGSTIILRPPLFTAEEYVADVARHGASFAFVVPTVLRWLLKLPSGDGPLLPSLRVLVAAADVMHAEEKRAVLRRVSPHFHESYSSSATGTISILKPWEIEHRAASVGYPNLLTEVQIVDPADRPLPPDEIGRLRVRGPGVATRYYGDPEAEARDFKDGWYYTGELAARDDAGYLYLKGRASNMILRGGVNIYPEELEPVIEQHPRVAAAAVLGATHAELGQEVVALIVPAGPLAERELLAHCRRQLAPHKVPSRIVLVDDLPRNPAGKIRRAELGELLRKPAPEQA